MRRSFLLLLLVALANALAGTGCATPKSPCRVGEPGPQEGTTEEPGSTESVRKIQNRRCDLTLWTRPGGCELAGDLSEFDREGRETGQVYLKPMSLRCGEYEELCGERIWCCCRAAGRR